MTRAKKAIPDGFHTVTPHLCVKGAAAAIDFYGKAFGADVLFCNELDGTDTVVNAQLAIGDSIVMLNDEFPDHGALGPVDGHTPVTVHLYVEDADAAFARAVEAGATVRMPLMDAFWGDRFGVVDDPFGHRWSIGTRTEDLTPDEIAERARQAFAPGG